jgi:SecD/SecF fusion protein
MSSLWKRILLQVVVLAACAWFIWPPEKQIRYGRDLAGGISLVYNVQVGPGEDSTSVVGRVIDAVKERIDPKGVMEIAVTQLGAERIEITMPLPGDAVKKLRQEFDQAVQKLGEFRPTPGRLQQVFALPAAERDAAITALASGRALLADKLKEAAGLYDSLAAMDARLAALPAEAPAADRDELIAQRAQINPKYRAAVDALTSSVISPETVRRVLELPTVKRSIKTDDPKVRVLDDSQQDIKFNELLTRFPLRANELKDVATAYQAYSEKRVTLDDPQDLMRLLRGSGELAFRITIKPGEGGHPDELSLRRELAERGPAVARRPDARWFKINDIASWYDSVSQRDLLRANPAAFFAGMGYVGEAYLDGYYLLCWDTASAKLTGASGNWAVSNAMDSRDEMGKPAIAFTMDNVGSVLLGDLTARHVGQNMAIVLDDEVYTAPRLLNAISRNGNITGVDSDSERQYVIKVLVAGALQAKLSPEPISQSILSPTLGRDNLQRGLNAGYISFAICAGFLIVYYFTCGLVSTLALALNTFLLIALMALNKAAFTLPGIAGVILAFAMAVDANVLIFERMREELAKRVALKEAVGLGYNRAMSAIIDGNSTHLLVCSVLFIFGTTEIRGFAVTMSIGVVTTLFAQLVFTRLLFDIALKLGWRTTSMLPMAVPAVQRAFTLNVDWMRLRGVFYATCLAGTIGAFALIGYRNREMFDTEFRGGTQVVLQLRTDPATGQAMTLKRGEVEERFLKVAETDRFPRDLRNVTVQVIDPRADLSSDKFSLKTLLPDTDVVSAAVLEAFGDAIERRQELKFKGSDLEGGDTIPAFPINRPRLGDVIGKPEVGVVLPEYRGGIATLLEEITPPVPLRELRDRVTSARNKPGLRGATRTLTDIVILAGDESAVRSAVLVSLDAEHLSIGSSDDWRINVRDTEWAVVRSALTEETSLLSANEFSPAIAKTFVAQAILCVIVAALLIVLFIWIRFNSIRFSIAAIVPTLMDCLIAIGLIAAAELIYDNLPAVANALGMVPFKIDLTVVASVLTVLGYSINDKIVLLDRIRENRGKAKVVTRQMVNDSVNQCISRTLLTGTTTILSTVVLYTVGGDALKPFAYTLGLGIVVGTLSSIMLAAPMVCGARRGAAEAIDDAEPTDEGANPALPAR